MAKAGVDINDLPPKAKAQVLRQLAAGYEGPAANRREYRWYERVFRYSVFSLAYLMLGLGSTLQWIGERLIAGGQETLRWIRAQT